MRTTARRVLFLPVMAAAFLTVPFVLLHAQGGGSVLELVTVQGDLSVGSEVSGALSSSDTRAPDDAYLEVWSIDGVPGESVTFDLIADDFDPYLYVTGPGFGETLRDDDSGGACYARITMTFLEPGTFRVVASSTGSRATGGARWPAVQVTLFGGTGLAAPAGGAFDVAHTRCQRGEYRVEVANRIAVAADHKAVAAFQSPHAATGADVEIAYTL